MSRKLSPGFFRSKKKPGRSRVFHYCITAARLLLNLQFRTTVLRTTGVGCIVADRIAFTMTDRAFQTAGVDTMAGQVVIHDLCTTLGQALVVFVGTLRVGVTGNRHVHLRITLQGIDGLVKHRDRIGTRLGQRLRDVGLALLRAIELEVHAAQVDDDLLCATVRTDDGAGRGTRALVVAIVDAVAIAVEGGAIRRRRGRRDRSRSCGCRSAEARDHAEAKEPVAVTAPVRLGLVVMVVAVTGHDTNVRAVGNGLRHAAAQFSRRRPTAFVGRLVVAAHQASQQVRTPCVPVSGVETCGNADRIVRPTFTTAAAAGCSTSIAITLGAIDKLIDRHVWREETSKTKAIIELAAIGIAIPIVVIAANGRSDIPATVICRGSRVRGGSIGGGRSVLRMNGTYAAQGQRYQKIQALTFHQVSPLY